MSDQNFRTSFTVYQTPEEVFDAINNVRGWWSEEIDGNTDRLGAEFTFRSQNVHLSTHKITEFVPGKKIVWHTVDSHLSFVEVETEWNNTDIVFEITRKENQTELRFTHIGLMSVLACYGDCSNAWSFYINDSLRGLITTGKGQPSQKEREGGEKTAL